MKVEIKKEVVENFIKEKGLTKNKFSKTCCIAVKTFDKFMGGEKVELVVGLKIAMCMNMEYRDLFYWE